MKKYIFILALLAMSCGQAQARSLEKDYTDFKNWLNKTYGIDYGIDISFTGQRGAPSGKNNAVQTYIYPYLTWTNFDNEYGTGSLNMAYNLVRYGNHNAADIGNNIGVVNAINDFDDNTDEFVELYYSWQLGGEWNWLTLNAGQFPIYNFDGTAYDANQQVNFINYALSQNASSTYSTAGIGFFAEIAPKGDWSFTVGAQDATNVDAPSIRVNGIHDKHYTTFAQATYAPTNRLGDAEVSVLVYNQPWVKEQPQTTNGWSINLSQDIGEKWSVFGRINGVSGDVAEIEQSWVAGVVWLNPLNRNDLDQIGLAYAYNKLNEEAVGEPLEHDAEQVIEAYWAWGISQYMTITPDVQFYINPALNQKSDYATAFSLRFTLFL